MRLGVALLLASHLPLIKAPPHAKILVPNREEKEKLAFHKK